jgi:Predicted membrane protein
MNERSQFRLPHPLLLLIAAVLVAAVLTWLLPAGEYSRRDDPVTHRSVVVAGTYHTVPRAPVGPFAAAVAIPRGFVEAADVIAVVLLVGGRGLSSIDSGHSAAS